MNSQDAEKKSYGWKSGLAIWTAGFFVFATLSGVSIWLLPFSVANQMMVLWHTLAGLLFLAPAAWYCFKHWRWYRRQLLTHHKLLGYLGLAVAAVCTASGLVLTWQALFGTRISYLWDRIHLFSTLTLVGFLGAHVLLIAWRDLTAARFPGWQVVRQAIRGYALNSGVIGLLLLAVAALAAYAYQPLPLHHEFPADYSYAYGDDRPFAPSQATTASGGALDGRALAGSQSCGTAGCHEQIVREWEVSAHRYSAMDIAFQKIQLTMAQQNGPESTRYCGGCHDPISLFSGTKNIFTDTSELTSLVGYQEGVSCLACHGIHETDLKGNAHYTVSAPPRYLFELEYDANPSEPLRWARDFLIRAYPWTHTETLSKRLFKAPEYCAACHKQFIDEEINSVGWVQLQNQYDNWRKSHWNQPQDPTRTIECRECHMPLVDSTDPASGDELDYNRTAGDGKHRSHRFLAANQLMPALLQLPGWEEQTRLTEQWLRGEFEIPEIADKWAAGPAVSLELTGPESVRPGEEVQLKVVITSNKVGHDFPTGPLDIIQAWVQLTATDWRGREIFSTGRVDEDGYIEPGSFIFKAEPVDRYGNLIDRHNLWEMVGVRHRRALFPGFSDTTGFSFGCPQLHLSDEQEPLEFEPEKSYRLEAPAGGDVIHVRASLNYRKIDQYLLKFVFGEEADLTSAITEMTNTTLTIPVRDARAAAGEAGEE